MDKKIKQVAIRAAKEAGKIMMANFDNIKFIESKGHLGYFTNVDILCEKKVISIIKKNFPDHSILAEESGRSKGKSDFKWLIDPIDGTHNYMHGFHNFGVSIAVEYKKNIIFGVIYLPKLNEFYIAEKNKGAFLNNKQIRVSKRKDLNKALIMFDGHLGLRKDTKLSYLNKILDKIFRVRISGCAIYDLTSIATGRGDVHIAFSTHPWDVAAGFLLVEEAGGKITDFNGKPWNQYMKEFIATNKLLHHKVLKDFKS